MLVSEDNWNQVSNEFYTNKYEKHIAYTGGYKLLCTDDI